MKLDTTEANINEFGRFEELKKTVDFNKASEYFEKKDGAKLVPFLVNVKIDKLLKDFILSGGYDIYPEESNDIEDLFFSDMLVASDVNKISKESDDDIK